MPQKTPDYIQSVGRRKTAIARVRLHPGTGDDMVNHMPIEEYFPGDILSATYNAPFNTIDTKEEFYITVIVNGGGVNAQAEAVSHGIARALIKHNADWKPILRQANLVTRDPRMKERRKPGLAQAARAKKSSPKR